MRRLLFAVPIVALAGCLDFSSFTFDDSGVAPRDAALQQDGDLSSDLRGGSGSDLAGANADSDHDGYSIERGDCDDANPLVNPGAFEIPGNHIDDNCDQRVDEVPVACDQMSLLHPEDPTAFAGAIEICKPWLVSATWERLIDARARAVRTSFGQKLKPAASTSLAMLSTGIAADESTSGHAPPRPGTDFGTSAPNPLGAGGYKNKCLGGDVPVPANVNDYAALTVKLQVPTNATGFSVQWAFFTAEYPPPFVVMPAAIDLFGLLVDGKAWKGNAVFDADGTPISALSPAITSCTASLGCPAHACVGGTSLLAGTGFEAPDAFSASGGATGWMETSVPVRGGDTVTLTFFVYDAGDHLRDSTVLLDRFQWLATTPTCAGGPCASETP